MSEITWGVHLKDGVTPNLRKISTNLKVTTKEMYSLGMGAKAASVNLGAFNSQAAALASRLNQGMTAGLINGNKSLSKTAVLMGQTSRAVANMSGSADKATKSTNAFTQGLGRTLVKGFAMRAAMQGIAMVFQQIKQTVLESATAFREFELRMAEVSTIISSDLVSTTQELSAGVRALSLKYGKSANDLAKGLYDILSAAVPVEDSLNLLNIAAKAATAGLTDVSTSVDVLTSVMNAYGYSAAQMANVSDIMFKAVVRGKFHYEDLASALGYVTPIAAQAGVSFEELAASISAATRQGQHVDMVARGLALTIQNIIKPSQQAADAANLLGLDLSLASLQAEGLEGFLQKLAVATGNNAAKIAEIVPNMRSYRVAMVLASNEADEFARDLEIMENAGGATDDAFNKIATTVSMTKDVLTQYREEIFLQVL